MRYDETVKKFNVWAVREAELRKQYLETLETLQVNLPPLDEQFLPYRKPDDLFRTVKQLRKGAEILAESGDSVREAADAAEKVAIAEKEKIGARRRLRMIDEQRAEGMLDMLMAFIADVIDTLHHLKKLSKIENNPNGHYTQQYRQLLGAYREAMHNLHGGKARGRGRRKGKVKSAL